MHLLNLPAEVLSLIVNDTDRDTLLTLCLTEKHLLHEIARRLLSRNVAAVFDAYQKPKPNLCSFDTSRLSVIRTLSLVVHVYLELDSKLYSRAVMDMVDLNHVVGIFPLLSRANHDRTSNSHHFFNFSSFTGDFRTTRDILRGDEVTISYTYVLALRAAQQAHLRNDHSFICSCAAYRSDRKSDEACDDRRAKINQLVEEITRTRG